MGPELRDQGGHIHRPCSKVLRQLHEIIIVVSHYYGALLEPLKLINKCLLVVGIEIVVGEQPLKYILSHGAGIVTKSNSLPPTTGGTRQFMSSKRNVLLHWCSQKVKGIPHRPQPLVVHDWPFETHQKWVIKP